MRTHPVKVANDLAFFLLEVAVLFAYGALGWQAGSNIWRFGSAAILPVLVAFVWGRFAAPHAPRRLADPYLAAFQLVVFLVPAAVLAVTDRAWLGLALAGVAVVVLAVDRIVTPKSARSRARR